MSKVRIRFIIDNLMIIQILFFWVKKGVLLFPFFVANSYSKLLAANYSSMQTASLMIDRICSCASPIASSSIMPDFMVLLTIERA